MKNRILSITVILSMITLMTSCFKKHTDSVTGSKVASKTQAGPPVYIYKTKADYSQYIPIVLSADKKTIVSYPAPGDVYYAGELAYPTKLNGGYLLDNRGINKDAAFLKITYTEYSKLTKTPSVEELMGKILDKDPFTEIYNCGSRYDYKDLVTELNQLIERKDFSKFIKVK